MTSEKASLVKKIGHSEEVKFNLIFGGKTLEDLNLSGSSEDCYVDNKKYSDELIRKLNLSSEELSVSLKSGNTWQFHLGVIEEISTIPYIKENISKIINEKGKEITIVKYSKSFDEQIKVLKSKKFWDKYLKKGNLLCYNDKKGCYTFFKMDESIDVIIEKFQWRKLETGRIKGDCIINQKICKGVITIEFRNESHKQCLVLGSSGGKGKSANGFRLFKFLQENINSVSITPLN